MRILTRYVLKEVLQHAALGAALFTFVIFMRDVGRILELIVRNSAPLPSVAELFFLTLPTAFTITIPMGVLVGILIGLSRLAADSEVTAMRSSGMGAVTFVGIISIFAVAMWMLALVNSVWVAPRSAAELVQLQQSLKSSQASFAIQPRVFYENFKDTVLYVQDVKAGSGAAVWENVFLADIRNPSSPKVTVAERAVVINEEQNKLRLHLVNGAQHETSPNSPDQYNVTTFAESDIPIQLPSTDSGPARDPRPAELSTAELLRLAESPDPAIGRWYLIEFHRRLALPTACLVLAMIGIPLGLSSKKGGKSTGFVLTIGLVFLYYVISLTGVGMARQGKMPAAAGVWMANALFALAGLVLLYRVDRSSLEVGSVKNLWQAIKERFQRIPGTLEPEPVERRAVERLSRESSQMRFPLILDTYILRDFISYLGMILATFVTLMMVFTFFELLGDIIRNRVPLITVGEYMLNVMPSMIYLMAPLSVLVAVLVTFGLLQRTNELTAMKATGVSIYRAVVPVLVVAGVVSVGLFFFEQFYLPTANTRQEAIRNGIKGKPAQTFIRPDRKWIFAQQNSIYYYEHFDPDRNEFAGFSAFHFEPKSIQISGRTYAKRAHWEDGLNKWVFEKGWQREIQRDVVLDYRTYDVATFAGVTEAPVYFKKEVRQSTEMNYSELSNYINDLQQSGFDVVRLRVQLHKKFAFPMIGFVMALLAIPFSLTAGRRGTLTGVGVALGLAVAYWMTSGLFEALGNVNQLPAALAAWAPDLLFGLAGGYLIFRVQT
ncbi:MAG TPA: LPS export ABC transporter permease LptF [Terriglobales bacterium]|nr:LPS export ABC transporter permease LptF [Terriglobales bacterium]